MLKKLKKNIYYYNFGCTEILLKLKGISLKKKSIKTLRKYFVWTMYKMIFLLNGS